MLCLSIRQPFIGQIISGYKTDELRTWPTKHRGPIALHCSKGGIQEPGISGGCVVATCIVTGCDQDRDGLWHWHLADVRRVKAVPWRGNAKFFKVPDELIVTI